MLHLGRNIDIHTPVPLDMVLQSLIETKRNGGNFQKEAQSLSWIWVEGLQTICGFLAEEDQLGSARSSKTALRLNPVYLHSL